MEEGGEGGRDRESTREEGGRRERRKGRERTCTHLVVAW